MVYRIKVNYIQLELKPEALTDEDFKFCSATSFVFVSDLCRTFDHGWPARTRATLGEMRGSRRRHAGGDGDARLDSDAFSEACCFGKL